MNANEMPDRIETSDYMQVGVRFVDNAWGSKAEWNVYNEVTGVVYHHDNDHGERVFSIIGGDVPGYFEWAKESDIMFIEDMEKNSLV